VLTDRDVPLAAGSDHTTRFLEHPHLPLSACPAGHRSAISTALPAGLSQIRSFSDGRRTGLGLT
jgi:hypothetical protein